MPKLLELISFRSGLIGTGSMFGLLFGSFFTGVIADRIGALLSGGVICHTWTPETSGKQ